MAKYEILEKIEELKTAGLRIPKLVITGIDFQKFLDDELILVHNSRIPSCKNLQKPLLKPIQKEILEVLTKYKLFKDYITLDD